MPCIHPCSLSPPDTIYLGVWLYPELCGTRGAVIRSLTIYYVKRGESEKAGKEPCIREVNEKLTQLFSYQCYLMQKIEVKGVIIFISAVIF